MKLEDLKHEKLKSWIKEVADMCQPKDIYVCDGSSEEYDKCMQELIYLGLAHPLKKKKT